MNKSDQMILAITKDHKKEVSVFITENNKEIVLKEIKKLPEDFGSIFLIDFVTRDVIVVK